MFKKYSYIYDIINKNKNYDLEIKYLLKLVKNNQKKKSQRFLDYGCGTGKHLNCLQKKVQYVLGVDKSNEMLEVARDNFPSIKFRNLNFIDKKKFDVCYSFFHVFSYLKNNNEVDFFFKYISKNLKKKGLLIFDYWSKKSVLSDPPKSKTRIFLLRNKKILRKTSFKHLKKKDLIRIFFKFLIIENKKVSSFKEVHEMRYFSEEKINNFLNLYNFKLINYYPWLNQRNKKNWYKCVVAIKK